MKNSVAVLAFLCSATGAFAQQQPAPVKMECRDISTSGNVVFSNETFVNGMACHVVDAKQAATQPAPTSTAKPQPPQTASPSASTAPSAPDTTPANAEAGRVAAPSDATAVPTPAPDLTSMSINPGSTVFIAPMDGFENYMAAALRKKDVPLMPITDETKANYILKGTSEEKKASWAKIAFAGSIHSDDAASVQLIDRLTGAIVFAYAVNKKNTLHGQQTTAEACAKHLKEAIEKK